MIKDLNIYSWTYGYYIDSIFLNKISTQDMFAQKKIKNNPRIFSLPTGLIDSPEKNITAPNIASGKYNGFYNNDNFLEQSRQYISIDYNLINIDSITFNKDIFPQVLLADTGEGIATNLPTDKQPYILLIDIFNENFKFYLDQFVFESEDTIKISFKETLNNIKKILIYGPKPYRQQVFGSNVQPNIIVDSQYYENQNGVIRKWGFNPDLFDSSEISFTLSNPSTTNRLGIGFAENITTSISNYDRVRFYPTYNLRPNEVLDIIVDNTEFILSNNSVDNYSKYYGYLEFISKNNQVTNIFLDSSTIGNFVYYFLTDSNIQQDPRLVVGGTYINSILLNGQQSKNRIISLFAKKWRDYTTDLSDGWVKDCLLLQAYHDNNIEATTNYFNLDDFEFLDIYVASPVKLSYIDIQVDTADPPITPTPSMTVSPSISTTPTNTVTPSFVAKYDVGNIYVWGDNDYEEISSPINIVSDNNYVGSDLKFKNLFVGKNHFIASDIYDYLFPFGWNNNQQLGLLLSSTQNKISKLSNRISTIDSRWKDVAIGKDFSYMIDRNNKVYRWGLNSYGQLFSEYEKISSPSLLNVDSISSFDSMSVADKHVFLVDNQNNLYYGGEIDLIKTSIIRKYNINNWSKVFTSNNITVALQLDTQELFLLRGFGRYLDSSPVLISGQINNKNYRHISVGDNHVLVIDESGSLWGMGSNRDYQLGIAGNEVIDELILINNEYNWIKVAAGNKHSLAITDIGVLYGWGIGENHQFGFIQDVLTRPTPIWGGDWIDIAVYGNSCGGISRSSIFTQLSTATPTPTLTNTVTPSLSPPPPSQSPSLTTTITPTQTPTPTQPIYLFCDVCRPLETQTQTPTPTPTVSYSNTPTPTPTRGDYVFARNNFIP